jgi:hypothetical protein
MTGKMTLTPTLSQRERGKTANVEHCLFPLPSRERVRVRVKIRSEARFRLKSPRFSLRLARVRASGTAGALADPS